MTTQTTPTPTKELYETSLTTIDNMEQGLTKYDPFLAVACTDVIQQYEMENNLPLSAIPSQRGV